VATLSAVKLMFEFWQKMGRATVGATMIVNIFGFDVTKKPIKQIITLL
jgi:hypothetical protein